jgi:hypothetical protein
MDIYAAYSYKAPVRVGDPDDNEYMTPDSIDGHYADLEVAKAKAVAMFLAWAVDDKRQGSSLRPEVFVWAPSRSYPGRLALWTMYESAASAMDDPDHRPYPQMRESSFWVRTIKVDDSRADGLCHEVTPAGDCSLDSDHSGTHDWER